MMKLSDRKQLASAKQYLRQEIERHAHIKQTLLVGFRSLKDSGMAPEMVVTTLLLTARELAEDWKIPPDAFTGLIAFMLEETMASLNDIKAAGSA
jgi:hypothetical protein